MITANPFGKERSIYHWTNVFGHLALIQAYKYLALATETALEGNTNYSRGYVKLMKKSMNDQATWAEYNMFMAFAKAIEVPVEKTDA